MVDEYQLRKDLDYLKSYVDKIDVSDFARSSETKELLKRFDRDLGVLDGDLITFKDTVIDLKNDLLDFNSELIEYNGDSEILENKLENLGSNLGKFLTQIDGFATNLNNLGIDVSALDTQLNSAKGTFNSLGARLNSFDSDLNGLDSSVTGLNSSLNTAKGNFDSLGARLNNFDTSLGGLNNSLTGLDGDLSSVKSDLYDAEGHLKITSADITVLSNQLSALIDDLDNLGGILSNFEGNLDDFKDEVESEGIELSTFSLNSNILELFGAIATVKSNITTINTATIPAVQGDISDVQSDLYGTDNQGNPLDSETANSSSLMGRIDTVQTETIPAVQTNVKNVKIDLFGADSNGNPKTFNTATDTSLKGLVDTASDNIDDITDNQIPAVQTNVKNVKIDMFGQDSNGNPKTRATASEGSISKLIDNATDEITELTEETIPAVQGDVTAVKTDIYGDENNADDTGLIGTIIGSYSEGSQIYTNTVSANTRVNQQLGDVYRVKLNSNGTTIYIRGTANSNNQIRLQRNNSGKLILQLRINNVVVISDYVLRTDYIDVINGRLYYDNVNTYDVSSLPNLLYQINGSVTVYNLVTGEEGLIPQVVDTIEQVDVVQGESKNIRIHIMGADSNGEPITNPANATSTSIMGKVDNTISQIGDTSTSGTILYDIDQVQGDIGDVDRAIDGSLQSQVFSIKTIADLVVTNNSAWQLLWVGTRNSSELDTLISSSGVNFSNFHYSYDGSDYYVCDGYSWTKYDSETIEEKVEFICVVSQLGLTSDAKTIAEDLGIYTIYDLSNDCFYDYNSGLWELVTYMDYIQKVALSIIYATVPIPYGATVSFNGLTPQLALNQDIYNQISNKQDTIGDYELIHTQTENNFTAKVYCDSFNVYVSFASSGSTALTSSNGINTMMTLSCNAKYRPKQAMSCAILRSSVATPRLRLTTGGDVVIYTKDSSTTETRSDLQGAVMYPLKSRLP